MMKKVTIMVALSFAGMLCWAFTASLLKNTKSNLMGTWSINKVENKQTGMTTQAKKKYKVTFDEEGFSMHLDINSCSGKVYITSHTFRTTPRETSCTTACCDSKEAKTLLGILDSPSMKNYSIKNKQLIISDNQYTLWFTRDKPKND